MKKIIFVFSLLFSFHSLALDEQAFYHRAYCENNVKGRESKISQIVKESEDEKSVVFRMVLTHGLCDSIERAQGTVKFQKRMVQVGNYGLSHPLKKVFAKVESYKALSETELEARVSLNKEALKNRTSRKYMFDFWASDWVGFPYIMQFSNGESGVEISFEGFDRL